MAGHTAWRRSTCTAASPSAGKALVERERYMKAVGRLRSFLDDANEALLLIADETPDHDTAERIDSVRAGIKDALGSSANAV
jgi:hypothetical protein